MMIWESNTSLAYVHNGSAWTNLNGPNSVGATQIADDTILPDHLDPSFMPWLEAEVLDHVQTELIPIGGPQLHQAHVWLPLHNGWQSYTPATTGLTIGAGGTKTGVYRRVGRTVEFQAVLVFGTSPNYSNLVTVSLPVAAADAYTSGSAWIQDETNLLKSPASWSVASDPTDRIKANIFVGPSTFDYNVVDDVGVVTTNKTTSGQLGQNGSNPEYPASPAENGRIYMSGTYRAITVNAADSLGLV